MLGSLIAVPVSLPAYAWFFNCLRPALASTGRLVFVSQQPF
jgi:hypothetical protein